MRSPKSGLDWQAIYTTFSWSCCLHCILQQQQQRQWKKCQWKWPNRSICHCTCLALLYDRSHGSCLDHMAGANIYQQYVQWDKPVGPSRPALLESADRGILIIVSNATVRSNKNNSAYSPLSHYLWSDQCHLCPMARAQAKLKWIKCQCVI